MNPIFSGIGTALITPFKDDKVDYAALKRIIEFQIQNKIDALVVMGTTGEAPTLSYDEKIEIAKFAITTVNNHIPVIFGIGGNNPKEIIKLGKKIKESGGRYVMLSAPYYNKCTQDGAVKFFNDIANEIKLPMIVYNVPGRTGVNLEPQTLKEIAKNKYIAGIKEASGNMSQIIDVVRLCSDTPVYCGDDGLSLPCYSIGCVGTISVASNIHPHETRLIWEKRDLKMFHVEQFLYKALFCEPNPIPVKYAMHLIGFCENEIRAPLTIMSEKSTLQYGFRELFKSTRD